MSQGKVLVALVGIAVVFLIVMKPERANVLGVAQTDGVHVVSDNDPAMLAAFKKAQDSLDQFLALCASPPPNTDSFAVKVGVSEGGNREYFWVTPFVANAGSFSGRINNTPRTVSNVTEGQEIQFRRSEIVDWTYENTAEQKTYGNFTACAMLVHESDQNAAEFKRQYGLDCDG